LFIQKELHYKDIHVKGNPTKVKEKMILEENRDEAITIPKLGVYNVFVIFKG
jgi:hypothetical protein